MGMDIPIRKVVAIAGAIAALVALVLAIADMVDKRNEAATLRAELAAHKAQCDDLRAKSERLYSLTVAVVKEGAVSLELLRPFLSPGEVSQVSQEAAKSHKEQLPFALDTKFYPSAWLGDGEAGERYVGYRRRPVVIDGKGTTAVQLTYRKGPKGWAGIYWQYPDRNWGEKAGRSLIGARLISFSAKGEHGGEIVEFKSGGISGGRYRDSYEASLGKVILKATWTQYRIDLSGSDLSSVIGAFAWLVASADNERPEVNTWIANLLVE